MEPSATPARKKLSVDVVGVVLAAGFGHRLAPISTLLPKALCPVGNRPLVDLALDRLAPIVDELGVNAHDRSQLLTAHLDRRWGSRVVTSVESGHPLGTAGGIANMRKWIDGRGVVVVNADAWTPSDLGPFVAGWDGSTVRLLVHGSDSFGPRAQIVASTLPWSIVQRLPVHPSGLYEVVWKECFERDELEVVEHHGLFRDCGTPHEYLLANLDAVVVAGGSIIERDVVVAPGVRIVDSVIGAGAQIEGDVSSSVVWSGQAVVPGERLMRSIRAGTSVTVGPL